jgi:cytochrome c oxidase subunit 2
MNNILPLLLGMIVAMPHSDLPRPHTTAARTIQIEAKRFEYSPSEISVQKGQPVTLVVHSDDVAHGLLIKDLNVKADVPKGQTKEITFTPSKAGDYVGECSHFCGLGHGRMKLTVHVAD